MNEAITPIEQANIRETAKRASKVLGGLVMGAATGYAISKGVQEIIPIDNNGLANVYEAAGTGLWALMGASLANLTSE